MAANNERLFEKDVLKRLDRAQAKLEHAFPRMRKLIEEDGAFKTAKRFVDPKNLGKLSPGLKMLVDEKLPHLTIEKAVIDSKRGLFSEAHILVAKAHLIMAKMISPKKK